MLIFYYFLFTYFYNLYALDSIHISVDQTMNFGKKSSNIIKLGQVESYAQFTVTYDPSGDISIDTPSSFVIYNKNGDGLTIYLDAPTELPSTVIGEKKFSIRGVADGVQVINGSEYTGSFTISAGYK